MIRVSPYDVMGAKLREAAIKSGATVDAAEAHAGGLRDAAAESAGAHKYAVDQQAWSARGHDSALRDVATTHLEGTKYSADSSKEAHLGAASITGKAGIEKAKIESAPRQSLADAALRLEERQADQTAQQQALSNYRKNALGILGVPDQATLQKTPDLQKLYNDHLSTGDLNALSQAHDNYQWFGTHAPNVDDVIQYAANKGYPIAPGVQQQIRDGIATQSSAIRTNYGPLFEDYAKNKPAPTPSLSSVGMGN